jgi:hypothetical protein
MKTFLNHTLEILSIRLSIQNGTKNGASQINTENQNIIPTTAPTKSLSLLRVDRGLFGFVEFIQICLWINSTKEGIVNYKWDFSFAFENLAWADSIKEGIVTDNSLK